jgi:ribosomal protein L37E
VAAVTERLRAGRHDLCTSCGRYAYDRDDNYCMACGYSEANPILSVLAFVGIALAVLAVVGWFMS